MLILTDENFKKEIQNAEKPILVDFWAVWCSPCFMLSPILEKIVEEYKDKVIFAKLNIDESLVIAREYQIDRIPVVLLFKEGKPVAGFMGVQPEELIREWLEKNLNGKNNGIVISSLHTREGTRVYSKAIAGGKAEKYPLTEEEEQVVKNAMAQETKKIN